MSISEYTVERVATAIGEADKWRKGDSSPDYMASEPAWKDYERQAVAAMDAAAVPELLSALEAMVALFGRRDLATDALLPADEQTDGEVADAMRAIAKARAAA
jgi:hypothetical protein